MKKITVDSGTILICDPCYLTKYGLNWNAFLKDMEEQKVLQSASGEIRLSKSHGTGILLNVRDGAYSEAALKELLDSKQI